MSGPRPRVSRLVAIVVGLSILVVLVLGFMAYPVLSTIRDATQGWTPVAVDAEVTREGDGVRLNATVSADGGDLGERAILDLLSAEQAKTVVEVLIDGAQVAPGAVLPPLGDSFEVSVLFRPADGSTPLTVPIYGLAERLRAEKVSVRLSDPPAVCEVPLRRQPSGSTNGGRSRVGDMVMQPCPSGSTVTVVSAVGRYADTAGALQVPEARVVLTF